MAGPVVFTNTARCRDCYRCVRVCPVKAIRMHQGQAFVMEEQCIACGTCIRNCPQGAKSYRNDVDRASRLLAESAVVAASIAPSFVGVFGAWQRKRLASALRKLGFAHVSETAIGAAHVAQKTAQIVSANPASPHVCSSCPAVVSYVERYEPAVIDALLNVTSPMVAHARHIKRKLGSDARVIFVGPCVAKKVEAQRPENADAVDCVLTFEELSEWLAREHVNLAACEESHFDEQPTGDSRYFPLGGGCARTAALSTDLLAPGMIAVSGFDDVREALLDLRDHRPAVILEPLMCPQGCINGPAIPDDAANLYERRKAVLSYGAEEPTLPLAQWDDALLEAQFATVPQTIQEVPEDQICAVLEKTGKSRPEDQLNCGACGYPSCRDKAVAVVRGMAEIEMCIPYMRRLAERRTDRIIETSPNGIVILDEGLNILSTNQAFGRYFQCTAAVIGKKIAYLMDPEPFERLAAGGTDVVEIVARHDKYNLVCHQILYPLRDEKQYVGIFVNITTNQTSQQKLDALRAQTILQAKELLEHQVGMAQKLAVFLGESTARGEQLVENLMHLADDENQRADTRAGKSWIWRTNTSK